MYIGTQHKHVQMCAVYWYIYDISVMPPPLPLPERYKQEEVAVVKYSDP